MPQTCLPLALAQLEACVLPQSCLNGQNGVPVSCRITDLMCSPLPLPKPPHPAAVVTAGSSAQRGSRWTAMLLWVIGSLQCLAPLRWGSATQVPRSASSVAIRCVLYDAGMGCWEWRFWWMTANSRSSSVSHTYAPAYHALSHPALLYPARPCQRTVRLCLQPAILTLCTLPCTQYIALFCTKSGSSISGHLKVV